MDHPQIGSGTLCACGDGRVGGYMTGGQVLCRLHLVTARRTVRRALATSMVVGSALIAINQGDQIVAGSLDPVLLWKVPLTYAVPYLVTTWGALSGARIG